ncbi:SMODS domain-containing nucleotidyltransferase [Acinetobacter baumannii]|uniref:SMODS domain-containing nucleotidyltransferase n=1 Tax=Acinetobacter baumannii TaxID=470 RepID=UPI0021C8CCD5|nr:nucleotidyltransferase [Acinetobacter baumannii]
MSVSQMFQDFLSNIKVDNEAQITTRYQEITKALNQKFRNTESKTDNCLQVGSYGRWSAIKGISDLDMLYIMPASKWSDYNKDGGQSTILKDTKEAILDRYPRTTVFVDRLVVCVQYTNFHVEVQPVFKMDDGSYKYPDTYNGGSWKITKPQDEIDEMKSMNDAKNRNLRRLCKMARAWKNKHGISMGGLLIDTLAYNFMKSTTEYDDKSYLYYDLLSRDFFKFLADQPDRDHYQALGSNQDVKVKSKFQEAAQDAYELCLEAIPLGSDIKAYSKWRMIYGRNFPKAPNQQASMSIRIEDIRYEHTEQFIEDQYPIDIRYKLKIESRVFQDGQFVEFLRGFKRRNKKLNHGRRLSFYIDENTTPTNLQNYSVKWKVLNRGEEAKRRNCIRGQIIWDDGSKSINEYSSFNGEHLVECYIIQNGVVVARDRIHVPIGE